MGEMMNNMQFSKGSIFKDEDELNRYLINKYPDENINLHRLSVYMKALAIDEEALIKSMTVPGSPFLKLPSRD